MKEPDREASDWAWFAGRYGELWPAQAKALRREEWREWVARCSQEVLAGVLEKFIARDRGPTLLGLRQEYAKRTRGRLRQTLTSRLGPVSRPAPARCERCGGSGFAWAVAVVAWDGSRRLWMGQAMAAQERLETKTYPCAAESCTSGWAEVRGFFRLEDWPDLAAAFSGLAGAEAWQWATEAEARQVMDAARRAR